MFVYAALFSPWPEKLTELPERNPDLPVPEVAERTQMGYRMRFGLISADRTTMERKPKESFFFLGRVYKTRGSELF